MNMSFSNPPLWKSTPVLESPRHSAQLHCLLRKETSVVLEGIVGFSACSSDGGANCTLSPLATAIITLPLRQPLPQLPLRSMLSLHCWPQGSTWQSPSPARAVHRPLRAMSTKYLADLLSRNRAEVCQQRHHFEPSTRNVHSCVLF